MSTLFNYFRYGSDFFSFLGVDDEEVVCSSYSNCISPLLFYLGWRGDKRLLIDLLPREHQNLSDVQIINLFFDLGYSVSEFEVDLFYFEGKQVPALFIPHDDENRPLVIIEKRKDKWKVFDSKIQDIIDLPASRNTYGRILLFSEDKDSEQASADSLTNEKFFPRWMNHIIFRHEYKWYLVILYTFFINLSTITTPIFVMVIYDKVVGSKDLLTLKGIILGLFLSVVFEAIFRYLRLKVLCWIAVRMDFQISKALYSKLIHFPYLHLEGSKTSTHVNRTNLFESIKEFIVSPPGQMLLDIPAIILYLLVIWILAGRLVLVPIGLIFIYTILIFFVREKQVFINEQGGNFNSKRTDIIEEIIYQVKNLRKSGLSDIWSLRLENISGNSSFYKFKTSLFVSNIENICYFLSMLAGLVTLVLGVTLVWEEVLTIGGLIGTMMLIWRVISPLQSFATTSGRFFEMNNTMKRIHKILTYETESDPTMVQIAHTPNDGSISFKNVGLKFQGSKDSILSGFTMEVKSGDFVTLSGASGSGKTSVLKLINSVYIAQMGSISIGGINQKQMNEVLLRRSIGYIGEEYKIFEGTLRENLKVINPSATDKDIIQCLVESGAWKNISKFDKGLDFQLSANDSSLPMSLKYQICLARELLKKSKIILLDQLDNSLFSSDCIDDLTRIIDKNRGKVTIVLVTNRNDLISKSDMFIALLGAGQAVAGPPKDLIKALKKNGISLI
ncbi:peptidase domain-containing ABC transporter [Halobacteriovorax sp. HLS]|uniref:peptidase domain-containing ABC transporter n=1 Tax=Halobacteriovorax sp. HLS TaxID=2234000 RepID=UPI000FDC6B3F|nr:ATP-binding cassette domain-containing protein [Halobacteriovorax sp. HLS]